MVFEACDTETVALPALTGVTVSVGVSPHEVNVTDDGLTVATAVSEDATLSVSTVEPVRLQPFLPSPFVVVR